MKYSLDKVVNEVRHLSSRMRNREETTDILLGQAANVHTRLSSMRQYQEEVLSFAEISKRVGSRPKGQLMLCLAAENKQLEQLRLENKSLRDSLAEHEAALEMIMTKYRGQVSKLLKANQVEQIIHSVLHCDDASGTSSLDAPAGSSAESTLNPTTLDGNTVGTRDNAVVTARFVNGIDIQHESSSASLLVTARPCRSSDPTRIQSHAVNPPEISGQPAPSGMTLSTAAMMERMTTMAAIARDVTDQGDAYAAELEEEVHRLRTENAGLRELLLISSAYSAVNDVGLDDTGLTSHNTMTIPHASAGNPSSELNTIRRQELLPSPPPQLADDNSLPSVSPFSLAKQVEAQLRRRAIGDKRDALSEMRNRQPPYRHLIGEDDGIRGEEQEGLLLDGANDDLDNELTPGHTSPTSSFPSSVES